MRILPLITWLFSFNFAFAQSEFNIQGKIDNCPKGVKVLLIHRKNGSADTLISQTLTDGKFRLTGDLKQEGEFFYIKLDTSVHKFSEPRQTWRRIVVTSSPVTIQANYQDWPKADINNSPETLAFDAAEETANKILSLFTQSQTDSLQQKTLIATYKKTIDSVIRKNADSYAAAAMLNYLPRNMFSSEEELQMFKLLSPKVQTSYYGDAWKTTKLNASIQANMKEQTRLPALSFAAPDGNQLNTDSLIKTAEYTLIDFWASWCQPCREEFPNMKTVYSKFRDKGFNIISVAVMDSHARWRQAMQKEALPWLQGIDNTGDIAALFGLNSLPAYVLVNQQGELIAYQCASSKVAAFGGSIRGEDLDSRITELISK